MTHETETLQEEKKAEAHSFDLSLLWLWPILLFQAMCEVFAEAAQELKGMRRKTYLRPSAEDWAMHVENLRRAEWLSRAYLAGHALSLLAGKPVDPSNALVPRTPDGWRRPEPKTVEAMLRRFEALSRLYADPMRYIRRLAHRLAAQARAAESAARHVQRQASTANPAECVSGAALMAACIPSWTLGAPAPP